MAFTSDEPACHVAFDRLLESLTSIIVACLGSASVGTG